MYFHNNSLLACVETNIIKTSYFEAMSNEKRKQKCYIYLQCVLSKRIEQSAAIIGIKGVFTLMCNNNASDQTY